MGKEVQRYNTTLRLSTYYLLTPAYKEREVLASFRCREAECFKPCDRATVLAAVRNDWGSEEAFDTFVQNDLVKVLEESKTRYSTWLAQVISDTLELMFGN